MSKIQVGDVFVSNDGSICTVVDYRRATEVFVRFDGYDQAVMFEAGNLRKGRFRNPYQPTIYGVGFIGDGPYQSKIGRKSAPAYISWCKMLDRCYSQKYQSASPTYVGCYVNSDWHNFQNFADWYHQQPNSGTDGYHLDKDLIVFGNKEYGDRFCSFVPAEINLLKIHERSKNDLPVGVTRHWRGYRARVSVDGKLIGLGTYPTPELAFYAYKRAKEENIKRMADIYKDVLDPRIYENLIRAEVEI